MRRVGKWWGLARWFGLHCSSELDSTPWSCKVCDLLRELRICGSVVLEILLWSGRTVWGLFELKHCEGSSVPVETVSNLW